MHILGASKKHKIKAWLKAFEAMWQGKKRFEYRLNDRNYQQGDTLEIREWDEKKERYTGRILICSVPFIMHSGFNLPAGYCIMTIGTPQALILKDKDPHKAVLEMDSPIIKP